MAKEGRKNSQFEHTAEWVFVYHREKESVDPKVTGEAEVDLRGEFCLHSPVFKTKAIPADSSAPSDEMSNDEVRTERLVLRSWREEDREPFARMNADPRVMEFFPETLSRDESDALVDRAMAHFVTHGFGPWAAELRDTGAFIGYVGLSVPRFEAAFTPCVEIGWRLAAEHWGRGLATEGAGAVVERAFGELGLAEIVSFTSEGNVRSRRVMERLGMTRDAREDFDHPSIAEGHRLRRHVLYRLKRENWR
jgi:RimJ/RimL family protein N-acetyltransferase